MIQQIFLLTCDWSKRSTWLNLPQLKLGDIREYHPSDIPQFSNLTSTTISLLLKLWEKVRKRFVVLTEEGRYFLFVKFVPENTKKTSQASYSKLFVNNVSRSRVLQYIWRIGNTTPILRKKMLVFFSSNIICSSRSQFSSSFTFGKLFASWNQ